MPAAEVLHEIPIPESVVTPQAILVARPFTGATIVFEPNRVLLCDVNICSDANSSARRIVLDLMSRRRDGRFAAYTGDELASEIRVAERPASMSGFIRNLRNSISLRLFSESKLECGKLDVISRSDRGYRFSDLITVSGANVPDEDVPNVPNIPSQSVDDVPNPSAEFHEASMRANWILSRLTIGAKLTASMIAKQFKCSIKTGKRDLGVLKAQGKIEFVGTTRTGYYRLKEHTSESH